MNKQKMIDEIKKIKEQNKPKPDILDNFRIIIHDTHGQRDRSRFTEKILIYDKIKKDWVEK